MSHLSGEERTVESKLEKVRGMTWPLAFASVVLDTGSSVSFGT